MRESLLAEAYSCLTMQARANETKYTGVSSADAKGSFGKSSTSAFGSIGEHIAIMNLLSTWLRLDILWHTRSKPCTTAGPAQLTMILPNSCSAGGAGSVCQPRCPAKHPATCPTLWPWL